MSLLSLLLLLGMTAPQNQPSSAQSSGDWLAVPVFTVEQFNAARSRQLQQRRFQQMDAQRSSTCYAIKSYIFEREDGNAPALVATTTCTPAMTLRWQQVDRPPQPRLVPAR